MKTFRRIIRRKSSLAFGCLLWWALNGFPTTAQAQFTPPAPIKVTSIIVSNVGPQSVSESLVRANIRIKEGDTFNRNSLDDDVRNLYSTGYFENVRVAEERRQDGISLMYIVWPRLKVTDVLFTGNKKYSSAKLMKKITSVDKVKKDPIGKPLDERQIFTDAQEIKKLYEKAGYPRTTVVPKVTPDERSGRATVTFEITEAPKIRISNVVFEGADAFKQRKLRKVFKTRRHWWLSWLTQSGTLKEDQLDDDKERIAEFYRDAGYIDFELLEVKQVPQGPKKMELRVAVSEGRQYKVGAVDYKGVALFPTNDITAKLKMGAGQTFTPKGLSKDMEIVQDLYGTKGYIDARVVARKNANTETGNMDLVYDIDERDKAFIEKIEIKGNTKTKDRVIRRELSVSPGEVFDMVRVKRSVDRLKGLNFFDDQFGVDAQPEPTDVPNRRNLVVTVREKNTGNIQLGAGFTSIDSLIGFVEVTQGNFDLFNAPSFQGAGQKARLRIQMGTQRKDVVATFVEPWFLERKLELSTELYHRELNFLSDRDTYSEQSTGMRVGLTKALGTEFLRGGLTYTLESVNIDLNDNLHGDIVVPNGNGGLNFVPANVSEEIAREAGRRLVSKVGTSLIYDTTDSYLLPTKGFRSEFRAELAGGPWGGDVDFYKIELKHAQYVKGFWEGHLLELGGRTGVAESYNGDIDVPLFDRFFLGGLDSLRGYRYRDIGPRDRFREPLGGDTYWFGTAEYSVPIVERVRFAAFYDIGMVYKDSYYYNFHEYADNWGLGIRLLLPIGPLRLDYGIPIHNSSGKAGSGKFQFSAGYRRDF
ncbi:MAG: outer membrane protein assembly factor BamA [Verrucomicrobia bacterium]|nr:outer membrane protein assembly factor BamA [Verrucomicrobiota bacterium]